MKKLRRQQSLFGGDNSLHGSFAEEVAEILADDSKAEAVAGLFCNCLFLCSFYQPFGSLSCIELLYVWLIENMARHVLPTKLDHDLGRIYLEKQKGTLSRLYREWDALPETESSLGTTGRSVLESSTTLVKLVPVEKWCVNKNCRGDDDDSPLETIDIFELGRADLLGFRRDLLKRGKYSAYSACILHRSCLSVILRLSFFFAMCHLIFLGAKVFAGKCNVCGELYLPHGVPGYTFAFSTEFCKSRSGGCCIGLVVTNDLLAKLEDSFESVCKSCTLSGLAVL